MSVNQATDCRRRWLPRADQALDAEAIAKQLDEHGQRYQVDLAIIGVEAGQREVVRTGWIVESGSDAARLITLYGLRRSK